MARGCGHEELVSDESQPTRTGAVEQGSRGIHDVESRCQATTSEDTAKREDLKCTVVTL
jgi:hypothetical protein